MKRSNDHKLSEALDDMLHSYHLKEKVNETKLKAQWEKIFGSAIARHTKSMHVQSGKLYLNIDSAPLRQELLYSKQKLINRINEEISEGFISDVILH